MPNKLTGELRLDLSQPVTAADLGQLLGELEEQNVDQGNAVITLQPGVAHQGGYRDPLHDPRTVGMQLVATWTV